MCFHRVKYFTGHLYATGGRTGIRGIMADQAEIQDAWNELAPGFDEFGTPLSIPLGEAALRFVDLDSGTQFLDVAAGSGGLSIPAARTGAQVVAIDFAPNMIERLHARARAEGLSNLESHVMDGHALELEDDTFDIAGSQNGVSLSPNLQRGLREMVRVTKPGGRILIVAAGPPQKAEWLRYFMDAMEAEVPDFTGLPMDPPPPTFQVADLDKLRQELTDVELMDVRVEQITWEMEFRSGKHVLEVVENTNPIGAALVADLTEQQRSAVQEALDTTLQEHSRGNGPAVLTTKMNIGIGTK